MGWCRLSVVVVGRALFDFRSRAKRFSRDPSGEPQRRRSLLVLPTRECRRNARRRRRRRPWRAKPDACGPPCLAALRSCDCWSRRSARPASEMSGFMPRHMLQPASRHSKPASAKDPVQPFGFGLPLHLPAAGHDHRRDASGDMVAAHHGRRRPQVFDAAVGAGADEHAIDADRREAACPGSRPMYSKACAAVLRSLSFGELGGIGHLGRDRRDLAGVRAPSDLRRDVGGAETLPRGRKLAPGSLGNCSPAGHGGVEIRAGQIRGRADSRTSFRPGRSCRPGRRPRSTCCRRSSALPWSGRGSALPVYSMP